MEYDDQFMINRFISKNQLYNFKLNFLTFSKFISKYFFDKTLNTNFMQ
jgi:hypothetical protein